MDLVFLGGRVYPINGLRRVDSTFAPRSKPPPLRHSLPFSSMKNLLLPLASLFCIFVSSLTAQTPGNLTWITG